MTREEAIFAADEDFYNAHPEYIVDGKRVPLSSKDPNEDSLRNEWMASYKAYLATDDPAEEIDRPIVPCPHNDKTKISSVLLKTASSKTDHGLLKDNYADWDNTGSVFMKPEYDKDAGGSRPTAQTRETELGLDIDLEIGPDGAEACDGVLTAKVAGKLVYREKLSLASGQKTISTDLTYLTPKSIDEHMIEVDYTFALPHTRIDQSVKLTCFSTFDTPKDEGKKEDGCTIKRMNASMELIAGKSTEDVPKLVGELFGEFKRYTLGFSHLSAADQKYFDENPVEKKELSDAGFAAYGLKADSKTSAWHLHDFREWGAECQAIVRYIRAILYQVGCPGTLTPKYVNANASKPDEAIVRLYGSGCKGPLAEGIYALADDRVEEGKMYGPDDGIGWNNYEAYLHLEHEGTEYWFGGGVGLVDAADILFVFFGLVRYELVAVKEGGVTVKKRKVMQLWKYKYHADF